MALQCNLTLSRPSTSVGQSPAPMLLLQVYNPNASAVVVTAVQVTFWDTSGNQMRQAPVVPPSPPVGPGVPTSVPALSSIFIGPFPLQVAMAANGNPFQMVPPSSQPPNSQPSQPLNVFLVIGALVYGSDGSANEAARAQLVISSWSKPPLRFQGGNAQFNSKKNSNLVAVGVG